jgi:hypothetical protein
MALQLACDAVTGCDCDKPLLVVTVTALFRGRHNVTRCGKPPGQTKKLATDARADARGAAQTGWFFLTPSLFDWCIAGIDTN